MKCQPEPPIDPPREPERLEVFDLADAIFRNLTELGHRLHEEVPKWDADKHTLWDLAQDLLSKMVEQAEEEARWV